MYLLEEWTSSLDTLCHLKVLYIVSLVMNLLFRKDTLHHAAVVMQNDTIILVGGLYRTSDRKTGEVVRSKLKYDN